MDVSHSKKRGFTLIEVLLFTAVFSGLSIVVLTILIVVTRVQAREGASAEVNQQSGYVLRTVQDAIARSSLVEMATSTATSTIKLRMASSSMDPTYIYASGTKMYVKETDTGIPQAITSDKVRVDTFSATRSMSPGANDTVSISLAVSYATNNLYQRLVQSFFSSAGRRVSAAVFDSNVVPSATDTLWLGTSGTAWRSINGIIYFSGTNTGVGVSTPGEKLEVDGGIRLNPDSDARPSCAAGRRGLVWFTPGSPDRLDLCTFNSASSTYAWTSL